MTDTRTPYSGWGELIDAPIKTWFQGPQGPEQVLIPNQEWADNEIADWWKGRGHDTSSDLPLDLIKFVMLERMWQQEFLLKFYADQCAPNLATKQSGAIHLKKPAKSAMFAIGLA
jgi:hypothetical protein